MAWIHRAAREAGEPLPKKLQALLEERTELSEAEAFYWAAFSYLSSCRAVGMAVGEIPWTAIDRYAERYQLAPDVGDLFAHLIHHMDAAYMKHQRAKEEQRAAEAAAAKNAPPARGGGRRR